MQKNTKNRKLPSVNYFRRFEVIKARIVSRLGVAKSFKSVKLLLLFADHLNQRFWFNFAFQTRVPFWRKMARMIPRFVFIRKILFLAEVNRAVVR